MRAQVEAQIEAAIQVQIRAQIEAQSRAESQDAAPQPPATQGPAAPAAPAGSRIPSWAGPVATTLAFLLCAAVPFLLPGVTGVFRQEAPQRPATVVQDDPPVEPVVYGPHLPPGPALEDLYLHGRLAAAGKPLRVIVPRLSVNSEIVPISGQSGVLLPPDDPKVLGWWREASQAGAAKGPTVLTGHTVSTGGGALDNLASLRRGDLVKVRTAAGQITYRVDWRHVFRTGAFAADSQRLLRLGGVSRLVLITCDDWNGSEYLSSAVVVARPVLDEPAQPQRP